MSILFDKLPSAVQIAGVEYPINPDYRVMAQFEQQILTSDRGNRETTARIMTDTLLKFYKDKLPDDMTEAINKMWWFYRCGEDITSKNNQAGTKNAVRLYDYEIDGAMIAAAFADTYHIDIINNDLHWWLFRSYFTELGENTRLVRIMSFRGCDLRQYKGKQRQFYAKMKKKYELPVIHHTPMTLEERDRMFLERYKRK